MAESGFATDMRLLAPVDPAEKALMLDLARFGASIGEAYEELAPHKICAYIYETANDFNRFYHGTKILSEEDEARRGSYLRLLSLVLKVLNKSIDILGFEAPDHMKSMTCLFAACLKAGAEA